MHRRGSQASHYREHISISSSARRFLKLATIDIQPLRHREFRLLFIGQLITFLGSQITAVAVPYQIYQLTREPWAVGLLGLCQLGPVIVLAFAGGALADARDRRSMALMTEVGSILLCLALIANALLETPNLWLLYVIATAQAGLFALQRPSLDAMLPRLVPRDELTAAGALTWLRGTFSMLLGPAVAGALIATVGLPMTYVVDLLTFVVSLVALLLMRAVPPPIDAERPSMRRIKEGLSYAMSRQELLGTYLVDFVAMFFAMPLAVFPAVADEYGGPAVLGLLYAAPAFGAFVATATSGWTTRIHRHGMAVILAAIAWGIAIVLFGLANSLPLALAALAAAGAADAVSGIYRGVIWNQTIPDALRGRLASIEMISYSTGPLLGHARAGFVASLVSVPFAIVSGGILCIIACSLCALRLPGFRYYDARSSEPNRAPVALDAR